MATALESQVSRTRKNGSIRNGCPLVRRLRELHTESGLTNDQLNKKAGLSDKIFYTWYRGESDPKLSNFKAVLNALGYDLQIVRTETD